MSKSNKGMSYLLKLGSPVLKTATLHLDLKTSYARQTKNLRVDLWINTFPAESGGARRCSRSLATSRLPYLEATCRGVKPFC